MKILVTGGAGFIGSNFIRYWLKEHENCELINLDALTYSGNLENLSELENNKSYRFVKGDIRDPVIVSQVMEGVELVVHFAAESHVDRSLFAAGEFVTTNVLGTQILCEAAIKAKVMRFHYIGTDEVFGALPLDSEEKFREDTPFDPRNQYSATKAAAEHIVRSYGHTHNLLFTITNCTNNFGPYQFPEKLIPLAVTNLLENKKVPVYGDGLNVRDWLYVDDHCRAIELVIEKGVIGESYLVGAQHEEVNNLKLIKKILKILGKDESMIEFVDDRPAHDRRYAVDWSKIKALGWKPAYDLDTWLIKTVEWYRSNASWWKKLKK